MILQILLAGGFLCAQPRTVDGDTLVCLSGPRIRIFGIQAPEARDPGGPQSTAAMARMVTGQTLACEDKGQDYFKRTVAICRLPNGQDIGELMIRQGQATEYLRYSGGYYRGVRP